MYVKVELSVCQEFIIYQVGTTEQNCNTARRNVLVLYPRPATQTSHSQMTEAFEEVLRMQRSMQVYSDFPEWHQDTCQCSICHIERQRHTKDRSQLSVGCSQ